MKKLCFILVSLSLIQTAHGFKSRNAKNGAKPNEENSPANYVFEGRTATYNQSSKVAIDVVLPMNDEDPDKGYIEEAGNNGKTKCYKTFRYCRVLKDTYQRIGLPDGSMYGSVLVRGNNSTPEPEPEQKPTESISKQDSSSRPICIVVPHHFWTMLGGSFTWYGYSIYYPDTQTKSDELDLDSRGHVGISSGDAQRLIQEKINKGECDSYRFGSAED